MNILFETKFGSHLYGTDTPASDLDFKGVYLETIDNIILKKDKTSINQSTKKSSADRRNTSEDTDIEYKELREYLREAMDGQTYALDMLFSPVSMHIHTSDEWKFIRKNYQKLLSKNVAPFIGYCRQQAGKYGLKGSRLGEVMKMREFFNSKPPKSRVSEWVDQIEESEYIKRIIYEHHIKGQERPVIQHYIEIIGKKYEYDKFVKDVLESLDILYGKYGDRAKLAMNNDGIDWKAISHAYRCCIQMKELGLFGKITFPLADAPYLKEIKLGHVSYDIVQEELPKFMEEGIKAIKESDLPEEPDREFWNEFILSVYKNEL